LITDRARPQKAELGMAEQSPGLRRQPRVDRQRVGLPQQFLEARGAVDAERQFDTVRQIGIVEHDAKVERLGAQRDRSADAPQPDDAKVLGPEPPDHRMVKRPPGRRRLAALQLMVQQDAAAQGQHQRHRMVSDLGGAESGTLQTRMLRSDSALRSSLS
jgi:hypothetical protein